MSLPGYPSGIGKDAHLKDVDAVFSALKTGRDGLTPVEAALRLREFGENMLKEAVKESLILVFLKKFTEPLILLLLASAAVSLFIGEVADAIGIALAVGLVSILGFIQEYRSERSVEALKKLTTHRCRVIREGAVYETTVEELVPGDVVALNVGDRVPADLRLFETLNLQIDESVLTGESEPAQKGIERLEGKGALIAERTNMAYMGTIVANGKGRGIVTATGSHTELGKISTAIQEVEEAKTPLQLKLDELGKHISLYAIGIIGVISLLGVLQGRGLLEMFTVAISLAVAAIPEGLPIVVTITLALGVNRMARRSSIVRRLPAVEALGATTVICTDKTGTLTKNEMTVKRLYTTAFVDVTGVGYEREGSFLKEGETIEPKEDLHLMELLRAAMLCNDAHLNNGLVGQPTEGALLSAAYKAGLEDERALLRRVDELPFDSERKWMSISYETPEGIRYFVKGAVERVIEKCSTIYSDGGIEKLTAERKEEVLSANNVLAGSALRVIALAVGRGLDELFFIGLAGIRDPPREGVKEAIKEANESHVKVIMITGDSRETAEAVTKELDFYDPSSISLSGSEVEALTEEELSEKMDRVNVFYRTAPEHKQKIVKALKKKGHIVAMTGDGVNDAPALKSADIGIAMGHTGTDVAKEASQLVLVDDNFATIIGAIEEGRSIYNNIKNFLRFEMTTSISAIAVIAFSTLLRLPLPLNPIQILWINVIMDGPPAQSLGVEPLDRGLMKKPPRDPREAVINRRMAFNITFSSVIMVVGTLAVFFAELNRGVGFEKKAVTMAFTAFVMFQMFNALNCRSEEKSIFSLGFFSNRYLLMAIAGAAVMQLAVIYIPFLQLLFGTISLSGKDLAIVTVVPASVFVLDEIRKMVTKWS